MPSMAISIDEYDSSTSDEESAADVRMRKAAQKLQRAFRVRKFVTVIERSMMLSKKRKQVLNEIISSEQVYVERLGQLIAHFVTPLSGVLSMAEVEVCFPMCRLLLDAHKNALTGASSRCLLLCV